VLCCLALLPVVLLTGRGGVLDLFKELEDA
jgi:hypothetical protein